MSVNVYDKETKELTKIAGDILFADSPIGSIVPYGGLIAPSGWMLCHGQAVSRTTYAKLFSVIGTSFGTGDGSTTFNLPDLREATTKGAGLTGKTVGNHVSVGGLEVGEFIDDRIQNLILKSAEISGGSWIDDFVVRGRTGDLQYQQIKTRLASYSTNRVGDTTEVKAVGVNYIIKSYLVGVPSDFMSKVDEAVVESNIYSTTERVIGRWIDGKPIYRKVFNWTTSTGSSTHFEVPYLSTMVDCGHIVRNDVSANAATPTVGFYNRGLDTCYLLLAWLGGGTSWSSTNGHWWVEYTKTTD